MSSIRLLCTGRGLPWESLIDLVGADSGCLPRVTLRDRITVFLIDDLPSPAASILKQCMLSGGADALVHREVLTCRIKKSKAIVYGTPAALMRGCSSLRNQPFALDSIGEEMEKFLLDDKRASSLKVNETILNYSDSPLIMGILNTTPDSFSDGGKYSSSRAAADHAIEMQKAGASIIDIGGESTKPGSEPVSVEEQLARVIPVIHAIREISSVPISIDTTNPEVAHSAILAGAGMINSVNALETPGMVELAVALKIPVVLMHMKGTPVSMQMNPRYDGDVSTEIAHYLLSRVEFLVSKGMSREMIIVDPGIGFGKRLEDNISLVNSVDWIGQFTGCRVLLGHSRKSFLGCITGIGRADQRDTATHLVTSMTTGVDIFRVHDVPGTVAALKVARTLRSFS